jgi:hypothetical protein
MQPLQRVHQKLKPGESKGAPLCSANLPVKWTSQAEFEGRREKKDGHAPGTWDSKYLSVNSYDPSARETSERAK